MVKINLLPWREELRQQRQREFLTAIGFGVLSVIALLMLVHMHIADLKDFQNSRNHLLETQIAEVDTKIAEVNNIEAKKNKLLVKIQLIQGLQESRPQIVHLFDEIAKRTPEGVFLTHIKQDGGDLTIEGKAQSNARVSAFMREVEDSVWLSTPKLSIIKNQESDNNQKKSTTNGVQQASDFVLFAKQGKPDDKPNNAGASK